MHAIRIRRSRQVAASSLLLGLAGLAAALVVDFLRTPFFIFVMSMAVLAGLIGLLDRRAQLVLSEEGVSYVGWGPVRFPWYEFSGYRRVSFRGLPYLQLIPRRPTEMHAQLSVIGRINHLSHRLLRIPPYSIAASALAVSAADLDRMLSRYLPQAPGP